MNLNSPALGALKGEAETLAPLIMLQILHRLEIPQQEVWQIDQVMQTLRIDRRFEPLIARWHHILHEEGLLELNDDDWLLSDCAPNEMQLEQRIDDGRHRFHHFLNGGLVGEACVGEVFADGLWVTSEVVSQVIQMPQQAEALIFSSLTPTSTLLIFEAEPEQNLTWLTATCLLQHAVSEDFANTPNLSWQTRLQQVGLEIVEGGAQKMSPEPSKEPRIYLARRRAI